MPEPSITESMGYFSSISALVGALVTGTPLAKLLHNQVKTNQRHESAIEAMQKQLEEHAAKADRRDGKIEAVHRRMDELVEGQHHIALQVTSGIAELKGYILGIERKGHLNEPTNHSHQ